MAVFTVPGWLQNAGTVHTAAQMRNYVGALIAGTNGSADAQIAYGGVNWAVGRRLFVTQTGSPSMAVLVLPGAAWIPGTESATQGLYGVVNDGNVTLSITTAHATLPRIDIVQIRVRDSFYSGVSNDALVDVKAGTPNSSPVAPAADANALVLAEVLVGAGVTTIVDANITSKHRWLAAVGGVMLATTTGQLPNTTNDIGTGQLVYNLQTKELVLNDSGYQVVYQVAPAYQTVEGKDSSVTTGSTTSTTFTNTLTTTGIRGVSFIAPPSGKAVVHGLSSGWNSLAVHSFMSFEVRVGGTVGSGSVHLASNENTASEFLLTATDPARHKVMGLVTGMTAGSTYNACLTYRVPSGTGSYARRHILVQPVPY